MHDFKDKVALVTSAARKRGIGHVTAVRFAMDSANVVMNGRYYPPAEFLEEERAEGWLLRTAIKVYLVSENGSVSPYIL